MPGVKANTSVVSDFDVYIAPLGSVVPVADAAFAVTWKLCGLSDGTAGSTSKAANQNKDFYAWGSILVATSRNQFKVSRDVTLYELDNEAVMSLLWDTSGVVWAKGNREILAITTVTGEETLTGAAGSFNVCDVGLSVAGTGVGASAKIVSVNIDGSIATTDIASMASAAVAVTLSGGGSAYVGELGAPNLQARFLAAFVNHNSDGSEKRLITKGYAQVASRGDVKDSDESLSSTQITLDIYSDDGDLFFVTSKVLASA